MNQIEYVLVNSFGKGDTLSFGSAINLITLLNPTGQLSSQRALLSRPLYRVYNSSNCKTNHVVLHRPKVSPLTNFAPIVGALPRLLCRLDVTLKRTSRYFFFGGGRQKLVKVRQRQRLVFCGQLWAVFISTQNFPEGRPLFVRGMVFLRKEILLKRDGPIWAKVASFESRVGASTDLKVRGCF